jgi:hypothetical protein
MEPLLNKKKRKEMEWTHFKPSATAKSIGRAGQAATI